MTPDYASGRREPQTTAEAYGRGRASALGRWPLAVLALGLLLTGAGLAPAARAEVPKDELVVHVYDVGQGSCVLIECPDGPPILNDCGKIGGGGDPQAAAARIRGRLNELRTAYPTPLQVLISHPHVDHYSVLVAAYGIPQDDVRRLYWAGPWASFSSKAQDWIDDLAERIDGVRHHGACAPGARVACLAPNEHALATPRLACGKAEVDILTAGAYGYDKTLPKAARKSAQGTSPNGESAVLRIRYAGASLVLPGDAEEVTQLYAVENATALGAPLARTTVLLLPHHGSAEYGSNDPAWAAATTPQVVIASANIGGNYGHPNCGALGNFDALAGAGEMVRLPGPFTARCGNDKAHAHESITLRHQFVFTETNGEVTIRVGPDGALGLTCERSSAACGVTH